MNQPLDDAHCHWHDARLKPCAERVAADLRSVGLRRAVVNGTSPADWSAVAELAEGDSRVIPAFGLHPWRVNEAPADWLDRLKGFLARFPRAGVGEVGLDRWIEGHDLPRQQDALRAQLELAAAENRPVSLHCLKAWGPLVETLRAGPLPERGFHLHGYGGSPELVGELAALGAYFSFSAYVMRPGKERHRAALRAVPPERLLLETDAPDMLPPEGWRDYALPAGAVSDGEAPHHPANITASCRAGAEVLGEFPEALAQRVGENFDRFFGLFAD